MLTLTASEFASLASVSAACTPDKTKPVLLDVQISFDHTTRVISAVATDRFRVARVTFTLPADRDGLPGVAHTFHLDGKALTGLAKKVGPGVVDITFGPVLNAVTFAYMGGSATLFESSYSFPPVGRLIPDSEDKYTDEVTDLRLNPAFLTDLGKLVLPGERAARAKEAQYHVRFLKTERAGKPGPIHFTRESTGGALAEWLVQPGNPIS